MPVMILSHTLAIHSSIHSFNKEFLGAYYVPKDGIVCRKLYKRKLGISDEKKEKDFEEKEQKQSIKDQHIFDIHLAMCLF